MHYFHIHTYIMHNFHNSLNLWIVFDDADESQFYSMSEMSEHHIEEIITTYARGMMNKSFAKR